MLFRSVSQSRYEAEATGMLMAADLSWRLGWITQADVVRVKTILQAANLPVIPPTEMTSEQFLSLMAVDKTRLNGLMKQLVKHWGFHPNVYNNYVDVKDYGYEKTKSPDIMTPSQIGDWLRGYKSPLLYPVLCVIDALKFAELS